MVFPAVEISAKNKGYLCSGYTLVELMVATFISLIVITVITTLFINTQKHVVTRYQKTVLTKSLDNAISEISREVRRAGYSSDSGTRLTLADSDAVFVIEDNTLTFAYQLNALNERFSARLISYKADISDGKLKICYRTITDRRLLKQGTCDRYYSMLDENLILLVDYELEQHFPSSGNEPILIKITLSVNLRGKPDLFLSRTAEVLPRNQ